MSHPLLSIFVFQNVNHINVLHQKVKESGPVFHSLLTNTPYYIQALSHLSTFSFQILHLVTCFAYCIYFFVIVMNILGAQARGRWRGEQT